MEAYCLVVVGLDGHKCDVGRPGSRASESYSSDSEGIQFAGNKSPYFHPGAGRGRGDMPPVFFNRGVAFANSDLKTPGPLDGIGFS